MSVATSTPTAYGSSVCISGTTPPNADFIANAPAAIAALLAEIDRLKAWPAALAEWGDTPDAVARRIRGKQDQYFGAQLEIENLRASNRRLTEQLERVVAQ